MAKAATAQRDSDNYRIEYITLRSVLSPEDQDVGHKRYCGLARASQLLSLDISPNVRGYLSRDERGPRKKTMVNRAILDTLEHNPDQFQLLNSGLVIVAGNAKVDDPKRLLDLSGAGIINGAQTQGVLQDFFAGKANDDGTDPCVNFELLVIEDPDLMSEISIYRNFQNRVEELSIFGKRMLFEDLEKAMQKHDSTIRLRKSETDYSDDFLDTEKLVQVLTALAPPEVALPSCERSRKTPETTYRVYAYRHRSRCLKDFALINSPDDALWNSRFEDARNFFLSIAWEGWKLYNEINSHQGFSSLHSVKGTSLGGRKVVSSGGVPDGLVFPILSALAAFVHKRGKSWKLDIPNDFPLDAMVAQAKEWVTHKAAHNPQTMGKDSGAYMLMRLGVQFFSPRPAH